MLPNDCGVPQGDVLAPSVFNHYTDSLRSPNDCRILRDADDIAVCSSSSSDTTSLPAALQHVSAWSQNHGLLLNESKCIDCIFYLRAPSVLPHPLSTNGTVLTSSEKVEYLGLLLTPNLSWGPHIEHVFIRGQKLAYSMKRVRSAGAPRDKLLLFIDALFIPLILYCSTVIFPALQMQDFVVLRRLESYFKTFRHTLQPNGIAYSERQMLFTSSFAKRILGDA